MPWLVVEGAGSWTPSLGREWQDSPLGVDGRPIFGAPHNAPLDDDGKPKQGRWVERGRTYKAGAHQVSVEVAKLAEATGYPWLIVMPDDAGVPELEHDDPAFGPVGTLSPADVREGKGAGVRLKVIEGGDDGDPGPVEEPVFEHECRWCLRIPRRTFPSKGALLRHEEFEHPAQFHMGTERAIEAERAIAREREQLRRISEHDKPVPVWDREAVQQAGLAPPPEPDPVLPITPAG